MSKTWEQIKAEGYLRDKKRWNELRVQRKIDMKIAREIFGKHCKYSTCDFDQEGTESIGGLYKTTVKEFSVVPEPEYNNGVWIDERELPRYSTTIKGAWMVVEEMIKKGWYLKLEMSTTGGSTVRFTGMGGSSTFILNRVTISEAICVCALATKGIEV